VQTRSLTVFAGSAALATRAREWALRWCAERGLDATRGAKNKTKTKRKKTKSQKKKTTHTIATTTRNVFPSFLVFVFSHLSFFSSQRRISTSSC
jgi:hypothetical protein